MSDLDYLRAYAVLDGEQLESLWTEIDRLRALAYQVEVLQKDAERWRACCADPSLFIDASFAQGYGHTLEENKAASDKAVDRAREAT
jgi:hypothetical protein